MHGETGGLDAMGVLWRLGATLFFVAMNGFFVAAEFALVKVRAARIEELSRGGQRSARTVVHILDHLDHYLSGCQLGITLASLALGALGEPAVSRLLLAAAHAAGLSVNEEARWISIVAITLAFTVITVLHMTVGEQAPKMLALRRAESMATATAYPLRVFTFLLQPFIALINRISNWMLRIVGLGGSGHGEGIASVEEIRSILSLSAGAGHIGSKEHDIVQNVLRITTLEVRHIMVPRVDAEYLSLSRPIEENMRILRESSHSRYPLCEADLDTVVGIVHGKDVLEKLIGNEELDLRALAREPLLVPDTMALADLMREMQSRTIHLAMVLDEHGTVVGLAFREDALEEIVGPLGDEFDDEIPEFREVSDGVWEVRGSMAFPDLCGRLGLVADDEGEETVAGYLVARLGRMPQRGDAVSLDTYRMTAEELGHRRVSKIRIEAKRAEIPGAAVPPPG